MSQTQTFRGADLLVESMLAAGARTLFGLPGDTGVAFYDALHSVQGSLRHVLARDERHAVAMADAYARTANRVGFVEVSSGGGTTYAVGGLGEAYASGIPIVLITSDIHMSSRGTGALTEIDQTELFSAVTKWSTVVEETAGIPEAIATAVSRAASGRPAPVAVIIPENVLDEYTESLPPADRSEFADLRRPLRSADPAAVAGFARVLSTAERPAILAGAGVHFANAYRPLAELAETVGAVVATSIHGKGSIADTHPWSVGVVGNNGGREYANAHLRDADAVLLVGTRANATDTNSWTGPARSGVSVAQIDIDEQRAGRNFPSATPLVGDAAVVLQQLVEQADAISDEQRATRATVVKEERTAWESARPETVTPEGQLPADRVIRLLSEKFSSDAVIIADPGTPTPNVASYWEVDVPGRTAVIPRGHGPMGYAIPAAVGAAFARPETPVLSITADGSFAMACGEIETVARLELPILFVQLSNNSLGWIKMLQHLYFDKRYFSVDPGPIDAVRVAEACGVSGRRIESMEALGSAIADFTADRKPLYLDIQVPHMIDVMPPVDAWLSAVHQGASRPVY